MLSRSRLTLLAQPKRHGMDCQIESGNDEEKGYRNCSGALTPQDRQKAASAHSASS